ncbi:gamma-carboxymuconolactone decarboxylase [Betaproteobacteria bacterium GR16-43]|nr:gamma-carboxymuconolactone decarboxylase [Betaproteobacteria bacterium GR16-43]
MSENAYRRGMKTRRKVLGDEWVDRAEATKTEFNAEFQRLITHHAWDDVWNRPHFDHRTRRLLTIAMLAALGHWTEYRLHVGAALRSGDLSTDDVRELLLTAMIYCGVPTANHGFKEARAEIDALKPPKKAKRRS